MVSAQPQNRWDPAVLSEVSWDEAFVALQSKIEHDPGFAELVRCYGGDPRSVAPSRRCARLALRVCERLGIDPAIYQGNVFGAAADAVRERRVSPR